MGDTKSVFQTIYYLYKNRFKSISIPDLSVRKCLIESTLSSGHDVTSISVKGKQKNTIFLFTNSAQNRKNQIFEIRILKDALSRMRCLLIMDQNKILSVE